MNEMLYVTPTVASQPKRETNPAVEKAIKELRSQLADLRMLVRAAKVAEDTAATEPRRDDVSQ